MMNHTVPYDESFCTYRSSLQANHNSKRVGSLTGTIKRFGAICLCSNISGSENISTSWGQHYSETDTDKDDLPLSGEENVQTMVDVRIHCILLPRTLLLLSNHWCPFYHHPKKINQTTEFTTMCESCDS